MDAVGYGTPVLRDLEVPVMRGRRPLYDILVYSLFINIGLETLSIFFLKRASVVEYGVMHR